MAIHIDRLDHQVYLNVLSGPLTLQDLQQAMRAMRELADQNQDSSYVVVSDAVELRNIPFDLQNLRKLAQIDPRMVAVVVVKSPFLVKVVSDIVSKVTPLTIEHRETREEALERARQLVQEHTQQMKSE